MKNAKDNTTELKQERKEKLLRVLQIMQNTDIRSPLNARQIVDKLDIEYQVGKVDRRAIYKDIVMLQSCGYPILSCKNRRKGWYYAQHVFEDWELKIMMDAVTQAKFITMDNAKDIKKKMLGLVSERTRQKFSHIMDVTASLGNKDAQAGKYLDLLLEALYAKKKIQFQYTEIDSKLQPVLKREGHVYVLSPYTLYWSEQTYYILGCHDRHLDDPNSYRLDRIRNLEILDEKVVPPEELFGDNPELYFRDYVKKSVNNYAGKAVKVVLEYMPEMMMNNIVYDFMGGDAFIRMTDEGKVRLTCKRAESPTLVNWIVQYADKIRVIEPDTLRASVQNKLRAGLTLNG